MLQYRSDETFWRRLFGGRLRQPCRHQFLFFRQLVVINGIAEGGGGRGITHVIIIIIIIIISFELWLFLAMLKCKTAALAEVAGALRRKPRSQIN